MAKTFGARLRYERERRQIALKSIAESTKIGLPLLDALERDDVSRWPSGIYRKSFIRSYAEAIGLDADTIVREFVERYPDPLHAAIHTPQDISAPHVASRAEAPSSATAGPLSIKLTIAWSGSVHDAIRKFLDCQIGRLRNLRIFQSANLRMVNSPSRHGSAGAAPDPAPPA